MKKLLIILSLLISCPAYAVLPNIFATQPAGNVAASLLDNNFTFLESQGVQGITTTGSANAYIATPADAWVTGYSGYTGRALTIIPNFTNTGASTVNVSGLGNASIYKNIAGVATALAAGDIKINLPIILVCDGTGFLLANPTTPAATATIINSVIQGFTPSSIAGANNTATMTVSAGQAADSSNAAYITNASTESWAVANGNAINGYSGGSTLPNSSTIHMYECSGANGVGSYAIPNSSYPLAAANCPAGYTTSDRRVFSFNTTGAGAPIPYTTIETEGGSTINWLTTQVLDINVANQGATRTLYTLSVPLGIKVSPLFRAVATSQTTFMLLTSPDETDVAPATDNTHVPLYDMTEAVAQDSALLPSNFLTTNTSGQIGARASGANSPLAFVTRGWKDFRRQ